MEKLLLVQLLIPAQDEPSVLLIEEHLLDSVAPTHGDTVHLLLTLLEPLFGDPEEASEAIRQGASAEATHGLLRPARDFPQTECRRIRPGG